MKRYAIPAFLVLGFVACMTPFTQQVYLVPGETSNLYSNMILALQELGFAIQHTDKDSLTISAFRYSTQDLAFASFGGVRGEVRPFAASINMAPQEGQTSISISITKPGALENSSRAIKIKDEIMKKFMEKLNK
ncbi:MAG: hypothetical protein WCB96_06735 [Candidatus Aminicenantales bacterium]